VRFAFAGTPRFASWVLRGLVESGRPPALVISQCDRARGRGRRQCAPQAVLQADCLGLEWIQTDDINSVEVMDALRARGLAALVVAAFGQLLQKRLLEAVLCLNVHASLLPSYRGAAPIERALAAGESTTGVTIMRIGEGLDEGPWAQRVTVSIGPRDDAGSLGRILAVAGAVAMAEVLDSIDDGTVVWTDQHGKPSYAAKLGPQDCLLEAELTAPALHDRVRSLSPAIGARAVLGELPVKVWRTWPHSGPAVEMLPSGIAEVAGSAGEVRMAGGRLFVGCKEEVLEILEIQPASKARMTTAAFLRGYERRVGARLTPPAPCLATEVG
jgi:methionyl-tRNA formyltransferase